MEESTQDQSARLPQQGATSGISDQRIDIYAHLRGISEKEVWRQIRAGKLFAKVKLGHIYIQSTERADDDDAITPDLSGLLSSNELEDSSARAIVGATSRSGIAGSIAATWQEGLSSFSGSFHSSELALLIDHLSSAREEQKEIVRLAQESIQRVTSMTEEILRSKDEVLVARESRIDELERLLDERERKIKEILRDNEDLATLNSTLASELPK